MLKINYKTDKPSDRPAKNLPVSLLASRGLRVFTQKHASGSFPQGEVVSPDTIEYSGYFIDDKL